MNFQRWNYDFDGAYAEPVHLRPEAGVYIVWCHSGKTWTVLDVGESEDVKARLSNHERATCWINHCIGTLRYSATYTPGISADGCRRIEALIRQAEDPPCGVL